MCSKQLSITIRIADDWYTANLMFLPSPSKSRALTDHAGFQILKLHQINCIKSILLRIPAKDFGWLMLKFDLLIYP